MERIIGDGDYETPSDNYLLKRLMDQIDIDLDGVNKMPAQTNDNIIRWDNISLSLFLYFSILVCFCLCVCVSLFFFFQITLSLFLTFLLFYFQKISREEISSDINDGCLVVQPWYHKYPRSTTNSAAAKLFANSGIFSWSHAKGSSKLFRDAIPQKTTECVNTPVLN